MNHVISIVLLTFCLCSVSCSGDAGSRGPRIELRDGLYGYVDSHGTEIIPCKYTSLTELDSLLFIYGTDNQRYGIIDREGRVLTPAKYIDIKPFIGERACARNEEGGYLLDRNGCEIAHENEILRLSANRFRYKLAHRGALYGLLDENGTRLTPVQFSDIAPFNEGLAGVQVLTPRNGMRWGFINENGKLVIPCRFQDAGYFSDGLAAVGMEDGLWGDSQWGYIDRSGKIVIPTEYTNVHPFSEGLAAVWDGRSQKMGYINKKGELAIDYQYDIAGQFKNGYALVGLRHVSIYIPDKYGAIDHSGRVIVPIEHEDSVMVWDILKNH